MLDTRGPNMTDQTIRFCVLYRWLLVPGKEALFQQAWEQLTQEIRAHADGLGSRLHRAQDGTWTAYAQWPSREAWESADVTTDTARAAMQVLAETVAHRFDPILLEPICDRLEHGPIATSASLEPR